MSSNITANKKVTKVQMLGAIADILQGRDPEVNVSKEDCLIFLDKEVTLLTKKNSTPSKAVMARRDANNKDREVLLEALNAEPLTCTQIAEKVEAFKDYSAAKVAALLKPLVADGQVIREVVKGKAMFSRA